MPFAIEGKEKMPTHLGKLNTGFSSHSSRMARTRKNAIHEITIDDDREECDNDDTLEFRLYNSSQQNITLTDQDILIIEFVGS